MYIYIYIYIYIVAYIHFGFFSMILLGKPEIETCNILHSSALT